MLRSLITSFLFIAWCLPSPASSASEHDLPSEKTQLLELLDEQTKLATKTRLNADYVPGIMTVLHGGDLETKGIQTVWGALNLVPGVTRTLSASGDPQLTIRGISDSLASGNVKILLNSVSVNSAQEGRANPIFSIPIEQVERIEFIRGPGSAVHGEYAYAGVLNVETYDDENRVFAGIDENNTRSAGALMSLERGDLHLGVSLSAQDSDGADVQTGQDALYQFSGDLDSSSHAPGQSNEQHGSRTAVAKVEMKGLTLLGQWTERQAGDHFGTNHILPPSEDRIVKTEQLETLEVRYGAPMTARVSAELYTGTVNTRIQKDELYAGPSEIFGGDPGESPVTADSDYEEARVYAGADFLWRPDSHTILVGLGLSSAEIERNSLKLNVNPETGIATEEKVDWSDFVTPPGTKRDVVSLTLQDEFRANESFTLTTGLRIDSYEEIGDGVAPRIAGVWRLNENNIAKLQYGRAFRPPTLLEQHFSDSELDPSIIDTVEASYIHKYRRGEQQITFAYSELGDVVVFTPSDFYNNASARSFSSELEFRERLGGRFVTDGNVSYVHTEDNMTGGTLALTSRWFGNLGLQYRTPGLNADLRYRYVDDYSREQIDPRDNLEGYGQLDLTLTRKSKKVPGLTMRAGLLNALGEDVRYPALMTTDEVNESIVSYPDDLPRDPRTWWLKLSYRY